MRRRLRPLKRAGRKRAGGISWNIWSSHERREVHRSFKLPIASTIYIGTAPPMPLVSQSLNLYGSLRLMNDSEAVKESAMTWQA